MRKLIIATATAITLSTTLVGCSDKYADACKDAGGKVQTEREKKTRMVTKTVNGKKVKKKETYYDTERECKNKAGKEVLEDEEDF